MRSDISMLALRTSMSSKMEYLEGATPRGCSAGFIHQATKAIRQYVAVPDSCCSEPLLHAMVLLAYSEFHRFNITAAEIHMQAVQRLVIELGGLDALSLGLRLLVISADSGIIPESYFPEAWFSLDSEYLEPGIMEMVDSVNHLVSTSADGDNGAMIPAAWFSLDTDYPEVAITKSIDPANHLVLTPAYGGNGAMIPAAFWWVLDNLYEFFPKLEQYSFGGTYGPERGSRQVPCALQFAAGAMLPHPEYDSLTDVVRLGILIWIRLVEHRKAMAAIYANHLKGRLEKSGRQVWVEHTCELRRWVLLTAALGLDGRPESRCWFLREFYETDSAQTFVCGRPKFDEEDIDDMLSCVLFLVAQRPMLPGLVQDLHQTAVCITAQDTGHHELVG